MVRGMDPNYTHPLFLHQTIRTPMLLDDWLNDWRALLATFPPFFLKNHSTCGVSFSFILRISIMHMGKLDQGWVWLDSCREVKISKVRKVWCKKGVRIVWIHPSYCVIPISLRTLWPAPVNSELKIYHTILYLIDWLIGSRTRYMNIEYNSRAGAKKCTDFRHNTVF